MLSPAVDGAQPRATASPSKPPAKPHVVKPPSPPPPLLEIPEATRLLVIAPHPDDDVLGAGGLMQRVKATGGTVRVVYLTDGDGYPEGVQVEDHVRAPTAKDYRGYGRQRRREARAALAALGFGPSQYSYTFLSFPDGGLCKLTRTYWSERRAAYRSPYTRLDRPPKAEIRERSTLSRP